MNPKFKSDLVVGTTMALVGIVAFSGKAVMVKLCYQYGVSSVTVLLLRMLFALPIYIGIAVYDNHKNDYKPLGLSDTIWVIALGFLGYYASSFLDFLGLQYIDASLERLILFVYPTMVVIISRFVFKKTIEKKQFFAIAVTYLGIGLAFYDKLHFDEGSNVLLGGGLVFICAITYAFYLAGSGELIPRIGTIRFTSYAIIVSCVAVIVHYSIFEHVSLANVPMPVVGIALVMAIFSTVLPSFLISGAIKKIGAPNVSILGSVGPFSTIALAMIFLGETISIYQVVGTFIVIGGVLLLNKK